MIELGPMAVGKIIEIISKSLKTIIKIIFLVWLVNRIKKFLRTLPPRQAKWVLIFLNVSGFGTFTYLYGSLLYKIFPSESSKIYWLMFLGWLGATLFLSAVSSLVCYLVVPKITGFGDWIDSAWGGVKKTTNAGLNGLHHLGVKGADSLKKAAQAVGAATKSLCDTSTKVTGSSVDKADELIQKVLKRKG